MNTVTALMTDGYKFSMGEAGWPLRRETFSLSFRKGGPQVIPFDLAAELERLLPRPTAEDWAYLDGHEYLVGGGYRAALNLSLAALEVHAVPRFSVVAPREPVLTITGPSALVSWLEPLLLQWSFRIQVATVALTDALHLPELVGSATCEAQRSQVLEALDAMGVPPVAVHVDPEGYVARVRAAAGELVRLLGDPSRMFEVGLRAATCAEQHLLALAGLRQAGVTRTSHVEGARQLGLTPVGTMGHEHVQRYGSDAAAFLAMVERRHQRSSFLLDTFDTITSGLPAAFALMAARPGSGDSIRYDSGDKEAQYRLAVAMARDHGLEPVHILEDGFDARLTARFEALREELGVPPHQQVYGYGGHLVARPSGTPLTRDRIAAVYKLTRTGPTPTMKRGNEGEGPVTGLAGKQSIPGVPVVFRRVSGRGPFGLVGQADETPPEGYVRLSGAPEPSRPTPSTLAELGEEDLEVSTSPATRALIDDLAGRGR